MYRVAVTWYICCNLNNIIAFRKSASKIRDFRRFESSIHICTWVFRACSSFHHLSEAQLSRKVLAPVPKGGFGLVRSF